MASWKKVLVSGSNIEVAAVTASAVPAIGSTSGNNVLLIDTTGGGFNQITPGQFQASLGQYAYTASADSGTSIVIGAADTLDIAGGAGIETTIVSNSGAEITVDLDYTGSNNFIEIATDLEGTSIATTDTIIYNDATDGNIKKGLVSDLPFSNNSGTVTSVAISGTDGIDVDSGSPITTSGTITLGLSNVPNASLANSSITVTAGSGLTNGGAVSLGSTVTLDVGAGTGITVNANDVALKNAGSLSNNTAPLWDSGNGQFIDSSITEAASVVTIAAGLEVGAPTGTALTGEIYTQNGVVVETGGLQVLAGDSTFAEDVTINGDLTVNGTTTTIDTTNLLVADKFALFASGSDGTTDGGIIVQQGATTGYALGVDGSADRWGLQNNLGPTATSITPDAYMVTAEASTGAPSTAPVYGGSSTGYGNIHVNTSSGEIFIYS